MPNGFPFSSLVFILRAASGYHIIGEI